LVFVRLAESRYRFVASPGTTTRGRPTSRRTRSPRRAGP
jgi:hypothetical protein